MHRSDNKFVARQAILDKENNTFGYELLYRNSKNNYYTGESPEKSTSQVIFQNHIMGNIRDICNNKYSFINFDQRSLLAKLPCLLDPRVVVIELLESLSVTPKVVNLVSELCNKGYKLALDDYDFAKQWEILFPYISFIKIDIEDIHIEKIASLIKSPLVVKHNLKIIVERVETEEQFNSLKAIGVDYFQGYFFHKPEIKSGYCLEPIKLNLLNLVGEIEQPFIEFEKVAEIISHDISLTSGLLKMVNSNATNAQLEITSVKQAVTFLGVDRIKQYVAIIVMTKLSEESTNELLLESLTRAKMMEKLSHYEYFSGIKESAFMTGLLSNVSAILKCPLKTILPELSLATEINEALIDKQGLLHEAFELVCFFDHVEQSLSYQDVEENFAISEDGLLTMYHESLKWSAKIST